MDRGCLQIQEDLQIPENGWKDAHEAMAMVGDAQSFKWVTAYMSKTKPEMDSDGWAWMLHGDMGEDNSEANGYE